MSISEREEHHTENTPVPDKKIGFSPEQRLPITLSAGIAVDGNTLKIAYGE